MWPAKQQFTNGELKGKTFSDIYNEYYIVNCSTSYEDCGTAQEATNRGCFFGHGLSTILMQLPEQKLCIISSIT